MERDTDLPFVVDIMRVGDRKAVYQLEVVPDENLFITLSGQWM